MPSKVKVAFFPNLDVRVFAIQRDLDMFERQVNANIMKFNKAKCKGLHLSCGNPRDTVK